MIYDYYMYVNPMDLKEVYNFYLLGLMANNFPDLLADIFFHIYKQAENVLWKIYLVRSFCLFKDFFSSAFMLRKSSPILNLSAFVTHFPSLASLFLNFPSFLLSFYLCPPVSVFVWNINSFIHLGFMLLYSWISAQA